jgi:hypothetical protein
MKKLNIAFVYLLSLALTFFKSAARLFDHYVIVHLRQWASVVLSLLALSMAPQMAHAALDFTALTAAVDATTIVAAITAIAAIKILPPVAKWGYNKVISWF